MRIFISILLVCVALFAQASKKLKQKEQEAVKKAIEKEKRIAEEQRFYQGDEYDLKSEEIDPDVIDSIPYQEPELDFDMSTGVYD